MGSNDLIKSNTSKHFNVWCTAKTRYEDFFLFVCNINLYVIRRNVKRCLKK